MTAGQSTRAIAVSVVMPARDAAPTLERALRALEAQQFDGSFEVIVVDDGSEDRTADIAASFGAKVVRQPHAGSAAARNAGLAVAGGEYWTILDADDVMPARRLEHQVAYLEGHPEAGAVAGLTQPFVTPGEARPSHYLPIWDEGPCPGHLGTLMMRRSVLQVVGPFDERRSIGEDLDWVARARGHGIRIGSIDELCLHYRIHAGNLTADRETGREVMFEILAARARRQRQTRV